MRLQILLFSCVVLLTFLPLHSHSQIISFYPEADTVWVGGGCTPPVIVCSSLSSTSVRDSLTIEPGWNTDMWFKDRLGNTEFFDYCYFIACDSVDQFEYEIWYQSLSSFSEVSALVPFDSSFVCEISHFKLTLFLMRQDIVIDSLSQFFAIRTGIGVQEEEFSRVPTTFYLSQNYPNPFNAITEIRYQISDSRYPLHTTLKIYNILGQKVRTLIDGLREPGYYSVQWNGRDDCGRDVVSGIYFYWLSVDGGRWSDTMKMVLLK